MLSNGYARPGHRRPNTTDTFGPTTGLVASAITRGREGDDPVTEVATFGGSAFRLPPEAIPVIVFGPGSVSEETTRAPGITPGAPIVPIDGWAQGAVWQRENRRREAGTVATDVRERDLCSLMLPIFESAVIEITEVPHTGCGKFAARFGVDALKWVNSPDGRRARRRGVYAKVLRAGAIQAGDRVVRTAGSRATV